MYKQYMSLIFDSYAYSCKQVKIKDNTSSVELDRSIVYPLCILLFLVLYTSIVQLVIEPTLMERSLQEAMLFGFRQEEPMLTRSVWRVIRLYTASYLSKIVLFLCL